MKPAPAHIPYSTAPRQSRLRAVLRIIERLREERGYPPSVREIGVHFGGAVPSVVWRWLGWLRDERLVDWKPGLSRTLHLTEKGRRELEGLDGDGEVG